MVHCLRGEGAGERNKVFEILFPLFSLAIFFSHLPPVWTVDYGLKTILLFTRYFPRGFARYSLRIVFDVNLSKGTLHNIIV